MGTGSPLSVIFQDTFSAKLEKGRALSCIHLMLFCSPFVINKSKKLLLLRVEKRDGNKKIIRHQASPHSAHPITEDFSFPGRDAELLLL